MLLHDGMLAVLGEENDRAAAVRGHAGGVRIVGLEDGKTLGWHDVDRGC